MAAVSDHGEVSAADSGRARDEEHRWGVRKLVGGSVWAEGGRRRELHGELGGGGGHGSALAREGERRGRLRQHGEASGEERAGLRARQGRHGRGRAS